MDRITRQNAALVEKSKAASKHRSNAAVNLLQLVQRFDLGSSRQAPQSSGSGACGVIEQEPRSATPHFASWKSTP
jgi:hypothetical protein